MLEARDSPGRLPPPMIYCTDVESNESVCKLRLGDVMLTIFIARFACPRPTNLQITALPIHNYTCMQLLVQVYMSIHILSCNVHNMYMYMY